MLRLARRMANALPGFHSSNRFRSEIHIVSKKPRTDSQLTDKVTVKHQPTNNRTVMKNNNDSSSHDTIAASASATAKHWTRRGVLGLLLAASLTLMA